MAEATLTSDAVTEALKTVYDPEIPVNVVDLGLIYDVQVNDGGNVYVQMTLTFNPAVAWDLLSPSRQNGQSRTWREWRKSR